MDITNDTKALQRLSNACEQIKRNLSADSVAESTLALESFLPDGKDFNSTLTRARFEHLCQPLFSKTLECVKTVLDDAHLSRDDITEVVLVGGSLRIPKVQEMLKSFFKSKSLNKLVNPDEAVACGAAIQTAILNNDQLFSVCDLLLMDVNPLSLGIAVYDGTTTAFIERNTPIPVQEKKHFSTARDNQTRLAIDIVEGEFNHVKCF